MKRFSLFVLAVLALPIMAINRLICWYLHRCGGAFHHFPYGKGGKYVVLMSEPQYGDFQTHCYTGTEVDYDQYERAGRPNYHANATSKLSATLAVIFLLALTPYCHAAAVGAAQSTNPPVIVATAPATNAPALPPTPSQALQQLWDATAGGATNWAVSSDGIYAPEVAKKFGAEGVALYSLTPNVFVGPRLIYINGAVYVASADLTLQASFHPLKNAQWLTVTPLADVGSGARFGKPSTTVIGIAEAGGALTFYSNKSGTLNIGIAGTVGKYTSFSGDIYTGGPFVNFVF